jgi:hypothetical protein
MLRIQLMLVTNTWQIKINKLNFINWTILISGATVLEFRVKQNA